MRYAFACALLLSVATPALACLNDRESVTLEEEFRSRYQSPANPGSAENGAVPASKYEWNAMGVGVSVGCAAVLAVSMFLVRRRLRKGEVRA